MKHLKVEMIKGGVNAQKALDRFNEFYEEVLNEGNQG